jgi:hypothetical protein
MPSISVTNPENITSLNLGTSFPKLGGTIDLSAFRIFKSIYGQNHDLAGFTNYSHIDTFEVVNLKQNKLSGDFPNFSSNANCRLIDLSQNEFTGLNLQTLPTNIQTFRLTKNNSSASSVIPDLSGYAKLSEYAINRQSPDYGVTGTYQTWTGVQTVASGFGVTSNLRVFNVSQTKLLKTHKTTILKAFYDAHLTMITSNINNSPTGASPQTISNTVNGITYNTPSIRVNGATLGPAISTTFVDSAGNTVNVVDAKNRLVEIGFTVTGYL